MKNYLAAAARNTKWNIHIPLLIFLLIFTVDKIILKFVGIGIVYLLHPDLDFRKNIRKVPAFYLLVVAMEIVKFFLFNRDFSKGHFVALSLGSLFWIISFLAIYQFRSIVDQTDEEKVYNTLKVFFLVNCVTSFADLLLAIYHSGSLNPYSLVNPVYGNSTGDLIKGLFMGPSYLNMMINAFFIFYFLYKAKFRFALLAMAVALLTTSNFGNLVLVPIMIACLILNKNKQIRLSIAGFLGMLVVFYLFASPKNLHYLKDSIWVPAKRQQELVAYEKRAKLEEYKDSLLKTMSANTPAYGKNLGTESPIKIQYTPEKINQMVKELQVDSATHLRLDEKYGKVQAFKQTAQYLRSGAKPLLLGAGMGSFSSFLAERLSGVNKEEGSRLFSYLPAYTSPEFYNNHYQVFKNMYALPKEFHSVKHFPNSWLNQLLGEYGLAGLLLFLLTYAWFFARHFRQLSYGKYLLFLMGGFLFFDYLFEYLSVVAVFELLMLCDIKSGSQRSIDNSGVPLQLPAV